MKKIFVFGIKRQKLNLLKCKNPLKRIDVLDNEMIV